MAVQCWTMITTCGVLRRWPLHSGCAPGSQEPQIQPNPTFSQTSSTLWRTHSCAMPLSFRVGDATKAFSNIYASCKSLVAHGVVRRPHAKDGLRLGGGGAVVLAVRPAPMNSMSCGQRRKLSGIAHSCVPHPDSSGCLAIPDLCRRAGPTVCRFRGVPKSRDAARTSAQCHLVFPVSEILRNSWSRLSTCPT